jgi:hypothetical protein
MPTAVIVAGQRFEIATMPRRELGSEKPDAVGWMSATRQSIRLANELGPDALRETLFHEVLHAIGELAALHNKERQVLVMAVQILDVLRRNPDLSRWLLEVNDATQEGSIQEGGQQEHSNPGQGGTSAQAGNSHQPSEGWQGTEALT